MVVPCVKNHYGRTYFDEFMPTCLRVQFFLRHSVVRLTWHSGLGTRRPRPPLPRSSTPQNPRFSTHKQWFQSIDQLTNPQSINGCFLVPATSLKFAVKFSQTSCLKNLQQCHSIELTQLGFTSNQHKIDQLNLFTLCNVLNKQNWT